MASSFEAFVAERFSRSQVIPLSGTNNDVYLVTNDGGSVVVKLVTDGDIPLDYLAEVNRVLARRLPTQAVREIHEACDAEPFDVVVADDIDGVDLAAVLGSDAAHVRHPDRPESRRNFGSPRPLRDDFIAHLDQHHC